MIMLEESTIHIIERAFSLTLTSQLQIIQKRDDHTLRINGRLADRPSSLRGLNKRPAIMINFGDITIISASDRAQKLRKRQQVQSYCSPCRLINRESFVEPVVVIVEVQTIGYPKMKQLVR